MNIINLRILTWRSIWNVKLYKMRKFITFITAVCILFLIKLRWPKNKSLYVSQNFINSEYKTYQWC